MSFALLTLRCSAWLDFLSAWNTRDTETSLVSITPDLNLSVEELWLGALTILEQVITQVVERVGEKSTPPGLEIVHTLETDSEMEFKQLTPTPDNSPIIRSKIQPTESKRDQTQCCLGQNPRHHFGITNKLH